MDDAEVDEEQEQKKERILIPVANPDTLDKLIQLALVVRDEKRTGQIWWHTECD